MPSSAHELGAVLSEKRATATTILIWITASVAFLWLGIAYPKQTRAQQIARMAIGGLIGIQAINLSISSLRCHEGGVVKRTLWGRRTIRYEDLKAMAYAEQWQSSGPVFTKASYEILLLPEDPARGKPVYYRVVRDDRASMKRSDPELLMVRDRISKVLAARMEKEIGAGRPAAWAPGLSLTSKGIEFMLDSATEPVLIHYSEVARHAIEEGIFRLWRGKEEQASLEVQTTELNFFPGHRALAARVPPS